MVGQRHYSAVFRLCRSILRNPEDAEDATQEVFVRVHQNLTQFAGRGAFGAWLRRLTVNHCLNRTQSAAAKASSRSCLFTRWQQTLPAAVDRPGGATAS